MIYVFIVRFLLAFVVHHQFNTMSQSVDSSLSDLHRLDSMLSLATEYNIGNFFK